MEVSPFFVTAVFLLGASVGGLLVSLQRQCTIERIRNDFERELTLAVLSSAKQAPPKHRTVTKTSSVAGATEPDLAFEEVAQEEVSWDHLPVLKSEGNWPPAGL